MSRATRAIIDLSALRHNLGIVRRHAPRASVLAVIKADAYGHGMARVAHVLQDGVEALGVATVDEALALRAAGIAGRIVVLEGFADADELAAFAAQALDAVVYREGQIELLESSAAGPAGVWLKIDTGMHRLGFARDAYPPVYRRLMECAAVPKPLVLMTHLANADLRSDPRTGQQIERFDTATEGYGEPRSIVNSAGLLGWPAAQRDWVRPGIMLYGVSPFADASAADLQLRPVMTLQSQLLAVNHCRAGDHVGYGGTWTCPEDMPVGVVAIGYGDGYPRHATNGTPVLVNGAPVPLVGRVSMDMICVDLRAQPEARCGDPVTLWGEGLAVEEVARHADTIAYELLCQVTPRVQFEVRE